MHFESSKLPKQTNMINHTIHHYASTNALESMECQVYLQAPRFSASKANISCVFFYCQHAQSYRIVGRGNYHLSHSKRRLQTLSKRKEKTSDS